MGVECGERTASRERGMRVVGASVGGVGEGRGSQNVRDTACSER